MKLRLDLVEGKKLVFDGLNDEFYGSHSINLDNGDQVDFSLSDIKKFKLIENHELKNQILDSCNEIHLDNLIPELPIFKNDEGLNVYFKETDDHFIILALGETQPGRYKIYLEGIFKKVRLIY